MNRSHDFTNCGKEMKKENVETLDNFPVKYSLYSIQDIRILNHSSRIRYSRAAQSSPGKPQFSKWSSKNRCEMKKSHRLPEIRKISPYRTSILDQEIARQAIGVASIAGRIGRDPRVSIDRRAAAARLNGTARIAIK